MARSADPHDGFAVERAQLKFFGRDLQRPECVLAARGSIGSNAGR